MNDDAADIADALASYLNQQLGTNSEVTPQTRLLEEGLIESLTMAELLREIDQRYQVQLHPAAIRPIHFETTTSLAALVVQTRDQQQAATGGLAPALLDRKEFATLNQGTPRYV